MRSSGVRSADGCWRNAPPRRTRFAIAHHGPPARYGVPARVVLGRRAAVNPHPGKPLRAPERGSCWANCRTAATLLFGPHPPDPLRSKKGGLNLYQMLKEVLEGCDR